MFERVIIALIRIVTNTFFRRIDVVGADNVPKDGPLILAGNHPNALMDGWLLVSKCGRWPLHFVANAKLWDYKMLAPVLDATGAVPVLRPEEHDGEIDNSKAFAKLYEVIEAGDCMGIFPEGVSHADSKLGKLKTGAARIALAVTQRGKARVRIIPVGLNYIHRHRFRSQVLIEFGKPIDIDEEWMRQYAEDEQETVRQLTNHLARALEGVTLNAPDWRTYRFAQTARRLYKPSSTVLSPGDYVELSRRFVERYMLAQDDPELQRFRDDVEDYQARLDMLGLKDHQLRSPVSMSDAFRKVMLRMLSVLVLLPLAIPGAILHLPVGWIATLVGEKFSYEMDDIASLKVIATILLLPVLYLAISIIVGVNFGFWWATATVVGLVLSFFISVRLIEAEAGLLNSMFAVVRLARLGDDVEDLRATRAALVTRVRSLADKLADPETPRMFTDQDFASN